MKNYSESKLDNLLYEALKSSNDAPDKALDDNLKKMILNQNSERKKTSISLWWLPAVSGSVVTCVFIMMSYYVFSYSLIFQMITVTGFMFNLFSWALTIIGISKFKLVKEALV